MTRCTLLLYMHLEIEVQNLEVVGCGDGEIHSVTACADFGIFEDQLCDVPILEADDIGMLTAPGHGEKGKGKT
ncbi:Von Willebrand factor, type A [Sesbania bispinosa]|nr:Von Willebrand factor, type A [Sesbania bispinosa]